MHIYILETTRIVSINANSYEEAEEKLRKGEFTACSERIVNSTKLAKKEND